MSNAVKILAGALIFVLGFWAGGEYTRWKIKMDVIDGVRGLLKSTGLPEQFLPDLSDLDLQDMKNLKQMSDLPASGLNADSLKKFQENNPELMKEGIQFMDKVLDLAKEKMKEGK